MMVAVVLGKKPQGTTIDKRKKIVKIAPLSNVKGPNKMG